MKRLVILGIVFVMSHGFAAGPGALSGDEILARIETEAVRRHEVLTRYSGSRQYTLQNARFGKEAAVSVEMRYRLPDGERYTVTTQSGSDKLIGIINSVMSSEARASVDPEKALHEISAANYRIRLLGTEVAEGHSCYILALTPKFKSKNLIVGKAWVDVENFGIVRLDGQFAASVSILLGAPRLREEFVEVNGFWLPGHVHSVTSSFVLGPSELEIVFSNYQVGPSSASARL